MRTLIRRLVLFPIALCGFPFIWFVGWCLDGNEDDVALSLLKDCWYGINYFLPVRHVNGSPWDGQLSNCDTGKALFVDDPALADNGFNQYVGD